jgi:hypothetical protein
MPGAPACIFLDDLHNDVNSLFMSEKLVQSDLKSLLMITAYRDDEIDASHPINILFGGLSVGVVFIIVSSVARSMREEERRNVRAEFANTD